TQAVGPGRRIDALIGALSLICLAGIIAPVGGRPPPMGRSPVMILFERVAAIASSPSRGKPAGADWAPVSKLAPQWDRLAAVPRDFNIVLVVLESVRSDVFWPAPGAVPSPALEKRAAQTAVFTRSYAHEPLSIKAIEALIYGIYPAPYWDSIAQKG